MNVEDVREIVEELRGHIAERVATSGVDATLAALGSPEELAGEYTTDELLARAAVSRSPLRVMASLFHWASLSIAGFFVLLGSVTGYFLGVALVLSAALKPFHPYSAGLWVITGDAGDTYSLRLGFGNPPLNGSEILGWLIIPVGLVAGCALVILTTRVALWAAKQFRQSRALPLR